MRYVEKKLDKFDLIIGLIIVFIAGMIVGGVLYYCLHETSFVRCSKQLPLTTKHK